MWISQVSQLTSQSVYLGGKAFRHWWELKGKLLLQADPKTATRALSIASGYEELFVEPYVLI